MTKILITGGLGQIGSELNEKLVEKYGKENVILTDIKSPEIMPDNPFEVLDVLDENHFVELLTQYKIDTVFHMAALLSGTAERKPDLAWKLNTQSLMFVLEQARAGNISQVFWPSSIAVFGSDVPKNKVTQEAPQHPTSMYGISKSAGESLCKYYYEKYGVDVRSVRYPGLISWKTKAGGGTTDYAVEIFYDALEKGAYECFLEPNTQLPMMYMDDAIQGTLQLMEAPKDQISVHTSYNINALSFTPEKLAQEIQKHLPYFLISYNPDFRQAVADSWPYSLDDSLAQQDWNWKYQFNLSTLVEVMLTHLKEKLQVS